jgi:ribonuclease HI
VSAVVLQLDGTPGSQRGGVAGVGIVARDELGRVLWWRSERRAPAHTCNEAEYLAVIAGLELVLARHGRAAVRCLSDSRLVVEQMSRRCAVRAGPLQLLHARATALTGRLERVTFVAIPRELNRLADALAWEALRPQPIRWTAELP